MSDCDGPTAAATKITKITKFTKQD